MSESLSQRPALLDTDIGSDVDDLLALVLLARAPELHLIGVTTVYGDTILRARMTRQVLDWLGRGDVPVGIGASETSTQRPVWWAGHEGEGLPDLDRVRLDAAPSAADLLRETVAVYLGQLDLFAIGPLTNVAAAIAADPSFAPSLHHLYVMGGAFWMAQPEHNIRCDPEAAAVVFRSGIPMTVCGLDVTERVWLREDDLDRIRETADGIGPVLEQQIRRWWSFTGTDANLLHDPLAVLAALHPELFRFEPCEVRVVLDGPELGRTLAERCGAGSVRIAAELEAETARREIIQRIVGVS